MADASSSVAALVSAAEHQALLQRVNELEELLEAVKEVVVTSGQAVRDVVGTTQSTLGQFDRQLRTLERDVAEWRPLGRRVAQLTDAVATHLLQQDPSGAAGHHVQRVGGPV